MRATETGVHDVDFALPVLRQKKNADKSPKHIDGDKKTSPRQRRRHHDAVTAAEVATALQDDDVGGN